MRKRHLASRLLSGWDKPLRSGGARLALIVLTLVGGASSGSACGIDWQRPVSHFDGVDEQGRVSYSEQIGELDLGDELKLPLFMIFNSGWEASSPYLGKGWNLCLLESRMEQVDENTFKLVQPDGWYRMFSRGKASDTVLGGQGGWKAEIKGDTITAYADCGWKLTFNKGKIVSMTTPKGRRLDWVYEGGRVRELREGDATRLKVEYGADGGVQGLSLPDGRRIGLAQDKRPRVQVVGGQNVVTGVDRSLSELTLADGQKQTFTFGTDDKTLPTLKVGGGVVTEEGGAADSRSPRTLAWNPQTLLIARDGPWSYQITPSKKIGENAAIGRTDATGQKEYWFYDGARGEETTLNIAGVKTVKTWFVAGLLAGKIRKIEEIAGSQRHLIYQAFFDEKGNFTRKYFNDATYTYVNGEVRSIIKNGRVVADLTYNEQGQLVSYVKDGAVFTLLKKDN